MKLIFWITVVITFMACTPSKQNDSRSFGENRNIKNISWLIGTWVNRGQKRISYEVWKRYDDHMLVGRSYAVQGSDTVILEDIKLVQQGTEIFYIPTVSNQNKGMPVTFKMILLDSNKLVFENPEHDFPQTIAYTLLSQDSLVAVVSGITRGEYREQTFPMRRIE